MPNKKAREDFLRRLFNTQDVISPHLGNFHINATDIAKVDSLLQTMEIGAEKYYGGGMSHNKGMEVR